MKVIEVSKEQRNVHIMNVNKVNISQCPQILTDEMRIKTKPATDWTETKNENGIL